MLAPPGTPTQAAPGLIPRGTQPNPGCAWVGPPQHATNPAHPFLHFCNGFPFKMNFVTNICWMVIWSYYSSVCERDNGRRRRTAADEKLKTANRRFATPPHLPHAHLRSLSPIEGLARASTPISLRCYIPKWITDHILTKIRTADWRIRV